MTKKKKDALEELSDILSFFLQYTDSVALLSGDLSELERNALKKAYDSGKKFWYDLEALREEQEKRSKEEQVIFS